MTDTEPEELSDAERARYAAARSATADWRDALTSGTDAERTAAAGAFAQALSQLDPVATRDKLHVPEDAGEYAEGLIRIMRRIPEGWGRWVSLDRGWYPTIVRLDEQLAALDPDYVLHQAKSKYAGLRWYFSTENGDDVRKQMDALVDAAEAECERTCEWCGAPGSLYVASSGWLATCCAACAAVKGYGLVGEQVPALNADMSGLWKVVTVDGDEFFDLGRRELHCFDDTRWNIETVIAWPRVGDRFAMTVRPFRYASEEPSEERFERVSGVITGIERVR